MRVVSIKLANCNRNFATLPFSHQKNAYHYGAFKVHNNAFWRHIKHLFTSNVPKS